MTGPALARRQRAGELLSDRPCCAPWCGSRARGSRPSSRRSRSRTAALDLVDALGTVDLNDLDDLAVAAEAGGNPVIPLVALLRERLATDHSEAARGCTAA